MKKVLLSLLVIIVLVSCSPNATSEKLTPPSWIRGTWSDSYNTITATFNSSGFSINSSGIAIDYSEFVKMNGVKLIDQVSTSTKYSITYEADGLKQSFIFNKVSDSSITYTLKTGAITLEPITLNKK